jgi:hypothetical protein
MNGTLNGQLSDVRIYGRALEPYEIGSRHWAAYRGRVMMSSKASAELWAA